jgi:hypothetical protein
MQTLPLLRLEGENSWREMLSDSVRMRQEAVVMHVHGCPQVLISITVDGLQAASVADNGVGSINAGGLAAMLDAYKDWSARRLAVVDQQQRTMHFDVMNAESEINRARKAYALCQQRAKATAEHVAHSTLDCSCFACGACSGCVSVCN